MSPRKRAPAAGRSMSRLERILLMVPYCVRHPGVSIPELAERLGAKEQEILEDLNLLFVCGLPEYTPADLIEVFIEEDRVYIRMADYFSRPLRLTRTEAIPLYVRGQALVSLMQDASGDLRELAPLRAALEKLARALLPQEGGVAELTKRIKVQLEAGEAKWLPLLRDAATQRRRVEMEYYTYSRDALTKRRVDPYLVFATEGHWYFSGYCHHAVERRMFRLDRIKHLELTDDTFEAPEDGPAQLPPPLVYEVGPGDTKVRLRVDNDVAVWLSEYLPVSSTRKAKGRTELTFHTSAFPWLEKLLMRFGTRIEVIEPAELGDQIRSRAKEILELYPTKGKR